MSFRSRSRNVQPVMQRRSLSGSRLPNNLSSYTNNRPLSSAYPSSSTSSYSTSNYISPYTSNKSRDSLYGSSASSRNSYYCNGGSSVSRRDSFNGTTIYKNPYTSDRYISPYATYDNGITTAGLSIKSSSGYNHGTNGSYANSYTPNKNTSSYSSSIYNKPLNRPSKSLLSASSTSLNTYLTSPITSSTSKVNRTQSFRDQTTERKSRNVQRNSSLKSDRSLSVSSEKSEGYESGSEKTSTRSRLGSSSSITSEQSPAAESSENGSEAIDYKALYEAARSDNDKLKSQLKKKDEDLLNARATIDRFTNATTKNTLSELEKRERRAMERKISEMEEELKQLQKFKSENERLRAENRALTRVVSKLTISAQNQLQNKK